MFSKDSWDKAKVGEVFTNEITENTGRFGKHKSYSTFDVKLDADGNGYLCQDAEHAFIISELASLKEKVDILFASLNPMHGVKGCSTPSRPSKKTNLMRGVKGKDD